MPLYKLTEKRMKKRAREDEDGITELKAKMREMGEDSGSGSEGWSESDSEDDGESEEESEGEVEGSGKDEDDVEEEDEDDENLEVDIEGLDSASDDSDDSDDEERDASGDEASSSSSVFRISLESALTQPIYRSPINPDEQLCVLCPDKALKNDQMIKVHLTSKGHKRASKRYAVRLTTNPPKEGTDPREVVEDILADMDAGELEISTSIPTNSESKSKSKPQPQPTTVASQDVDGNGGDKKRKRGKKQRQEEKAKRLAQAGQGQNDGMNRKARRLLALQKGEIIKKSNTTTTP
ncbi:uncharacterized protein IL334_000059 [Kwoniella shivajii]|uniref:U1-type domain-containing protein n=1 Tax=Kwoniella shivajii TaxID=564305 RepID=A0ABZ1CR52_9TREE|nr:hypothetical protein IL334_000059 [Kwoniella shivajii]